MLSSPRTRRFSRRGGFSLVELLTVIAIISILMTVGAVGIGKILGGKGTTSGVASAESLFDEARATAVSRRTKARVLIDIADPLNRNNYLRRMIVVYEDADKEGNIVTGKWAISGRGTFLPDQTYFSRKLSKKDQSTGGDLPEMTLSNVNKSFAGDYVYYEFNAEGITSAPGASFIVGTGARDPGGVQPRVTGSTKRDFGGFIVWRNGRTSLFRSPDQMNLPGDVDHF